MSGNWLKKRNSKRQHTGLVGSDSPLEKAMVNQASVSQIKLVPMDKIKFHPMNRQRRYDDDHILALADSIASEGPLQPCIVRPEGDEFLMLGGHYRYLAHKKLGSRSIECFVKDVVESTDQRFLDLRSLLSDNLQKEMSFMDKADMARLLVADDWPVCAISALPLMGTEQYVKECLAVWDLPKRLLDAITDIPDIKATYVRLLCLIAPYGRVAITGAVKILARGGNTTDLENLHLRLQNKVDTEKKKLRKNSKRVIFSVLDYQVGKVSKTHTGSKLELECTPEIIDKLAEYASDLLDSEKDKVASWCKRTALEKMEKIKRKGK